MVGPGDNSKSMAYVENVAAFLEFSIEKQSGYKLFNYADAPDFTMNELVSLARTLMFNKEGVGLRLPAMLGFCVGHIADFAGKLTGRTFPISAVRVEKFMKNTSFSSSAHRSGFVAPVPLRQGLAQTIEYEFLVESAGGRIFYSE